MRFIFKKNLLVENQKYNSIGLDQKSNFNGNFEHFLQCTDKFSFLSPQSQSNGSFIRCGSPTTTSQVMARKKRRGVIHNFLDDFHIC